MKFMMKNMILRTSVGLSIACAFTFSAHGASLDKDSRSSLFGIAADYTVISNVRYLRADNVDLKLDILLPIEHLADKVPKPLPTVIYFHGGGWVYGAKEADTLQLLPYL